jgi:hypothetical protein
MRFAALRCYSTRNALTASQCFAPSKRGQSRIATIAHCIGYVHVARAVDGHSDGLIELRACGRAAIAADAARAVTSDG